MQGVERWLAGRSQVLANSSLDMVKSHLNRAGRRAMSQDRVRRNVVELTVTPTGPSGRPPKSLYPQQIDAVLEHARYDWPHGYIVSRWPGHGPRSLVI